MIAYRQNYAALHFVPKPMRRERKPILTLCFSKQAAAEPIDEPAKGGTAHPAADLLRMIERTIAERHIPASQFGRDAVGDPRFVFDLRKGRNITSRTRARTIAWLVKLEGRG